MPEYSFICLDCESHFEKFMSMADYNPSQECPTCHKSDNVYRDYESDNVSGNIANRTLGALADKNTSKMSEDERHSLWKKHNEYRFKPMENLPKGMEPIDREKPFHDQPRNKKPKRKLSSIK